MSSGWASHKGQFIPLSLLEIYNRGRNKKSMATSCCTNACDIKMCSTCIGLFNCSVGITCAWLSKYYGCYQTLRSIYCGIPTWMISFPLRRWALYDSGLAMKAIPADRETSLSPDLCLMCSAEKFPSIINVRMSWFLQMVMH